jgi:hypothetical protein
LNKQFKWGRQLIKHDLRSRHAVQAPHQEIFDKVDNIVMQEHHIKVPLLEKKSEISEGILITKELG